MFHRIMVLFCRFCQIGFEYRTSRYDFMIKLRNLMFLASHVFQDLFRNLPDGCAAKVGRRRPSSCCSKPRRRTRGGGGSRVRFWIKLLRRGRSRAKCGCCSQTAASASERASSSTTVKKLLITLRRF